MESNQYRINSKSKPGDRCSKGFVLKNKITNIGELVEALQSDKSIFWNFKVTSSALFLSWQLRTLINSVSSGAFWTVTEINN